MSSDPHDGARVPPGAPALEASVVIAGLDVADAEDVLRSLAGRLLDEGAVTLDFPEALRRREERFPTGLPTPIPTAIPHADPEHVLVPGLALATLAREVPFVEMGGDGGTVGVRLVAMPLLTDASAHLAALQRMMALLRDEAAVQDLLDAADEGQLRERAARYLTTGPTTFDSTTLDPTTLDPDSGGPRADPDPSGQDVQ